jgi:EAL domain-containing protein (putative c-di-GMP-specific phosphodiesterase class I)
LFEKWHKIIREHNLPVAIVLQDGMKLNDIPFDKIDSVFIGGTDNFKLGKEVREIVKMAKLKNKWVHMGRVNSNKRLEYAFSIGCDSVDGSGYSMFPEKKIPDALKFLEYLHNRGNLF